MRILLPPSETKAEPNPFGPVLDLSALFAAEALTAAREEVMDAVIELSGAENAQTIFGVGPKVLPQVRANQHMTTAPCVPAHELYTGVLFDALDAGNLTIAQREKAATSVLIFSGLWGVTGFCDPIPSYRCAMDLNLSTEGSAEGPGRLGSFWKNHAQEPLAEHCAGELIVDCRSGSYQRAFAPESQSTVAVNNYKIVNGEKKIVTHAAKKARGELASLMLRHSTEITTVTELAELAGTRWEVQLREPHGKTCWQLDLMEPANPETA